MSLFNYIFGTFTTSQQIQTPNYDSPTPGETKMYGIDSCNQNNIILNNEISDSPIDASSSCSSPETVSSDQCNSKYPKLTRECRVSSSDTESLRSFSSMEDIVGQKYKRPRVTINNCVNVILIPTRSEYYTVGLSRDIWWSREELYNVKINCQEEILTHVAENNSSLTIKDVMRQLYQP